MGVSARTQHFEIEGSTVIKPSLRPAVLERKIKEMDYSVTSIMSLTKMEQVCCTLLLTMRHTLT